MPTPLGPAVPADMLRDGSEPRRRSPARNAAPRASSPARSTSPSAARGRSQFQPPARTAYARGSSPPNGAANAPPRYANVRSSGYGQSRPRSNSATRRPPGISTTDGGAPPSNGYPSAGAGARPVSPGARPVSPGARPVSPGAPNSRSTSPGFSSMSAPYPHDGASGPPPGRKKSVVLPPPDVDDEGRSRRVQRRASGSLPADSLSLLSKQMDRSDSQDRLVVDQSRRPLSGPMRIALSVGAALCFLALLGAIVCVIIALAMPPGPGEPEEHGGLGSLGAWIRSIFDKPAAEMAAAAAALVGDADVQPYDSLSAPGWHTALLFAAGWVYILWQLLEGVAHSAHTATVLVALAVLTSPWWYFSAAPEARDASLWIRGVLGIAPLALVTAVRLAQMHVSTSAPALVRRVLVHSAAPLWCVWVVVALLLLIEATQQIAMGRANGIEQVRDFFGSHAAHALYNGVALIVLVPLLPLPAAPSAKPRGGRVTRMWSVDVGEGHALLVGLPLAWMVLYSSAHLCFLYTIQSHTTVAQLLVLLACAAYSARKRMSELWLQCRVTGLCFQAALGLISGSDGIFKLALDPSSLLGPLSVGVGSWWAKTNLVGASVLLLVSVYKAVAVARTGRKGSSPDTKVPFVPTSKPAEASNSAPFAGRGGRSGGLNV